jgi:chromosome partitioning protein
MIIAIAGQKGGAGKSTVAVHLAAEWHRRGLRVLLVDADPQATALTWAEVAAEGPSSPPNVISMGDNLRRQLSNVAESYDITVIDCPGRLSKRQAGALMVADIAVIPCGPSTPDVWAVAESVDLIREVQELRQDLQAVVVINRKTRTTEGRLARESLEALGLPVLLAELGLRVAFSEALAAGLGVTEYAGGSDAAAELRHLADEIESRLQIAGGVRAA